MDSIKSWEVVGIEKDFEAVCLDCLTKHEEAVADGEAADEDIHFLKVNDALHAMCSRCGCPLVVA